MQTFLPYPDFEQSAKVLDRQRLGKQRVENLQLLRTITQGGGWRNHPVAKQWRDYPFLLFEYQTAICREWMNRGYSDTCLELSKIVVSGLSPADDYPWWLGHEPYHLSHQSNLLRKDANHYGKFFGGVVSTLPYFWPSNVVR